MRSSTSSSESRAWLITWLVMLMLVVPGLLMYERLLKSRGFEPSVEVTADLWSWQRRQVNNNPQMLVLAGASRMQLGVDPQTLAAQLPGWQVVSLAINAQYPMTTLEALAADPDFTGSVLVSFTAQMLEPRYWDMQQPFNEYHAERSSWHRAFNARLTAEFESAFRFFHPLLKAADLIRYLSKHQRFPAGYYVQMHTDTSGTADYQKTDADALKQRFIRDKAANYAEQPAMDHEVFTRQVDRLIEVLKQIVNRGGQVVLLRMPTDDGHWQLDEQQYPRRDYWDAIPPVLPDGIWAIHFRDHLCLSAFTLPDSSHLDGRDRVPFTRCLTLLLEPLLIQP
jgi:hypothetical protein